MRVLITGADGFIGSHLVEACLAHGYRVRAFVLYNSFNSWGWLETLEERQLADIEVVAGDVRDYHNVREAMRDVEMIFHLAALIGIPFSYRSPDACVDTNVKGTLNILQAARDHSVGRIVVTSTSEVYGTAQYVPIDEGHPLRAQSPYAATKIAADRLAESFYRSFGLPVVIARPFNTYGPRQSLRAVVPTIITQALSGADKIKLGSLHPRRDLNYVKDVCQGFITVGEADGVVGEEINIASGTEISIGDLAERIVNKINPHAEIISDDVRVRPPNSEVERLLGSCEKMKQLTGWKPMYDLEKGLSETVAWFRENQHSSIYKTTAYTT